MAAFCCPRKIGTNWFMPALVKSRFGASGNSDDDGTMVCCFSRKKSRNDCRICAEVMMGKVSFPDQSCLQSDRYPTSFLLHIHPRVSNHPVVLPFSNPFIVRSNIRSFVALYIACRDSYGRGESSGAIAQHFQMMKYRHQRHPSSATHPVQALHGST